jgi:hypothetical protein
MMGGLFQRQLQVRLPEDARSNALALPGAAIFEPMAGRPMREYVCLPDKVIADRAQLNAWLTEALEYVATLPPKKSGAKFSKRKRK